MNKKNNKPSYIFLTIAVWWEIALLLAAFQGYIMSRIWWIPLIILVLALTLGLFNLKVEKALRKKKRWADYTLIGYIVLHFIPIVLQIIGIKAPGLDNIATAIIGLILTYSRNKRML